MINFSEPTCREQPRTDNIFGICDDQDNTKAYSDTMDNNKWIATVRNYNNVQVLFTAIDNCTIILKPGTKDKESTCDGMLTFNNYIYLVELKKQGTGGWLPDAIGQLENTMRLMYATPFLKTFKYKKAFACNRKHPNFTVIGSELNKRMFREYGFRIDAQADIVIQ